MSDHDKPMRPQDIALVLENWAVVAEFFRSRNWPDTNLGHAAMFLHTELPKAMAELAAARSATVPAPDGHDDATARIEKLVREIEIICDHFGYDESQWLAEKSAVTEIAASEEAQRVVIDVEKMLCRVLGRPWSASGISVNSLVNDIEAKLAQRAEEVPLVRRLHDQRDRCAALLRECLAGVVTDCTDWNRWAREALKDIPDAEQQLRSIAAAMRDDERPGE